MCEEVGYTQVFGDVSFGLLCTFIGMCHKVLPRFDIQGAKASVFFSIK